MTFGFIVGLMFFAAVYLASPALDYSSARPQGYILILGSIGGLLGSLVDSILGATVQYSGLDLRTKAIVECPGEGVKYISGAAILDNHGVNLLSSIITAMLLPSIAMKIF